MRTLALGMVITLSLGLSGVASAAPAERPSPNIEAVKAAIDPAQGPPIIEPVYGGGEYAEDPSLGGPGGYWPERALRREISGVAVIKCSVGDQGGALTSCILLAEGPTTFGFGDAALTMAKAGRVKAKMTPDLSVGDAVRVVVMFKNPEKYWANH